MEETTKTIEAYAKTTNGKGAIIFGIVAGLVAAGATGFVYYKKTKANKLEEDFVEDEVTVEESSEE